MQKKGLFSYSHLQQNVITMSFRGLRETCSFPFNTYENIGGAGLAALCCCEYQKQGKSKDACTAVHNQYTKT